MLREMREGKLFEEAKYGWPSNSQPKRKRVLSESYRIRCSSILHPAVDNLKADAFSVRRSSASNNSIISTTTKSREAQREVYD